MQKLNEAREGSRNKWVSALSPWRWGNEQLYLTSKPLSLPLVFAVLVAHLYSSGAAQQTWSQMQFHLLWAANLCGRTWFSQSASARQAFDEVPHLNDCLQDKLCPNARLLPEWHLLTHRPSHGCFVQRWLRAKSCNAERGGRGNN